MFHNRKVECLKLINHLTKLLSCFSERTENICVVFEICPNRHLVVVSPDFEVKVLEGETGNLTAEKQALKPFLVRASEQEDEEDSGGLFIVKKRKARSLHC